MKVKCQKKQLQRAENGCVQGGREDGGRALMFLLTNHIQLFDSLK